MLRFYKLKKSYILPDDENYEIKLSKTLEVNGQKVLSKILETHKRPFVFTAPKGKEDENISLISKIVSLFKEDILINSCTYFKQCFYEHIKKPELSYSAAMREVLIKDLQSQLNMINVDNTKELFSEMSVILHEFDQLCHAENLDATVNALLPLVQQWFTQKYILWNNDYKGLR